MADGGISPCGPDKDAQNRTEDVGVAFVYPTPDAITYEGSQAVMSGPKYTDSNTNCRLQFWYYYVTDDENSVPLLPSIRHLAAELESVLDYLGPTGFGFGEWKFAEIGLGRQGSRFQVSRL